MRRSDHPSRPSAITCCRFSALKTLPIPAAGVQPTAQVNVSAPGAALAAFQVSINGRFWVSTEGMNNLTIPVVRVEKQLLTAAEVAAAIGVSTSGVLSLVQRRLLPAAKKFGSRTRWVA